MTVVLMFTSLASGLRERQLSEKGDGNPGSAKRRLPIISVAHNSPAEWSTKIALENLLARYDARPWLFTNEVVIDENSVPHSHPVLTINTRRLSHDDELISTYVHEQLHWYLVSHDVETEAAKGDLKKVFPHVPVGFPEGAQDVDSTYLHLLVCSLEERADRKLLGEERARKVMLFWANDHYRWIYRQIIDHNSIIYNILRAHHPQYPSDDPSEDQ